MAYIMTANEEKIVKNVMIPTYYNQVIVPKKRAEGQYRFNEISDLRASGLCPFHTDTDPSLHYWKDRNMFKCFGCNKAGSVVQMHMYWQKEQGRTINKETAIKELGEMFNIELDLDESGEVKTESVFESAKRKFRDEQYDKQIYSQSHLTLGGFRTFNNQIKNQIDKMPYVMGEQAANLYYKLDLTLSAFLAEKKEGTK